MEVQNAQGSSQVRSYLAAMATVLMWACNTPFTRFLHQYYSPGAIMVLRYSIASVILIILGIIMKTRLPKKKDLPLCMAFGACGIFLYMVTLKFGTMYVVAGVSSFLVASAPVFTIILSRPILKEVVKPACWVGVGLSFLGIMVVMFSQTTDFSLNIGVLLLIGTAFCGSVFSISQRKLVKTYTVLETATYGILTAAILMIIMFLPDAIREFPGSTLPYNLAIAYLGAFPTVLAYITWGYALSKAEKTTHVTVFLYLVPFIATIIGFLWLEETFSLISLFGGIAIIAGVVLTNALGRSK